MKQDSSKHLPYAVMLSAAVGGMNPGSAADATGAVFAVDFRSLVSRADLTYTAPAERSEHGMPVGSEAITAGGNAAHHESLYGRPVGKRLGRFGTEEVPWHKLTFSSQC